MSISDAAVFTYDWGTTAGSGVNREDLIDMIHNIDPWDTPLFTTCPKTQAAHVYHEWIEDTLTLSTATGTAAVSAVAEGADFSVDPTTTPTRTVNITQIFRKDVQVTNTQLAVNPAGVADTYKYEIAKALKEIKRLIEVKVLAISAASATGATGTARQMKNLATFLTTNAYNVDSTAIGGAGLGSGVSLTETPFNGVLQKIYESGGNPMDVYCSPAIKRKISSFTGTTYQQAVIPSTERTLIRSIDVYVSDFGPQYIRLDRWVPTASATGTAASSDDAGSGHIYFVDRSRVRIAFLRNPKHVPVASIGDSVRGMVLTELTLEVMNQKGHGRLFGLLNT